MEDDPLPISEIISTLWRRKWIIVLTSFLLLVIGVFVILNIPTIYRSTGLILVEQQEIPTQWVNSTVASYADERINAIGQRVLNTDNLMRIIEKFNLYPEEQKTQPLVQLSARARENYSVENVESTVRDRNTGHRGSATIAFRISFDDPSPETAKDVATELVSLYLDENVASRTKAIVDTRQFLESEADRLEVQLAEMEQEISTFKERNAGTLPEHEDINLQTFQRIESQIADIDRTLSTLAERRIILEAGVDSARRYLQSDQEPSPEVSSPNPLRERLTLLQTEFAGMQTRYSDAHPDLIKTKREIESLETRLANGEGVTTPAVTLASVAAENEDASLIRLTTDLRSTASEQESQRIRREELTAKLDELEKKINKTPEVEREYRSLIRDHENLRDKYNDIRAKQNSARVSESLEVEEKGERFTLIDPPRLPLSPHKPNRKKLGVMALGAAMLGGLIAALGLEKLDSRVRNISSVERASGMPVLASVGYIENRDDVRAKRNARLMGLLLVFLIVVAIWFTLNHYELDLFSVTPDQIEMMIRNATEFVKSKVVLNG